MLLQLVCPVAVSALSFAMWRLVCCLVGLFVLAVGHRASRIVLDVRCPDMFPVSRQLSPLLVQYPDHSASCVLCDKNLSCERAATRHVRSRAHQVRYDVYRAECRRLRTDVNRDVTCGRVRSDVPMDEGPGITSGLSDSGFACGSKAPQSSLPDRDLNDILTVPCDPEGPAALPTAGEDPEVLQLEVGPSSPSTPPPLPSAAGQDARLASEYSLSSVWEAARSDLTAAVEAAAREAAASNTQAPTARVVASVMQTTGCTDADYESADEERIPYHDQDIPAGAVRPDTRRSGQFSSSSDLFVRLLNLSRLT